MLRLLAVASAARCQPRAGAASTRRRAPHPITSFAPSNRRSAESIRVRAAAPGGGDSGDEVFDVADVVNVDAIRAAVNDDPEVRAQEAKIAAEARNAASLQVDAEMAQEEAKIALEMGATAKDASSQLEQAQEAALADLEAKSEAVLAAEAKMEEIARERRELLEEAGDGVVVAGLGRAAARGAGVLGPLRVVGEPPGLVGVALVAEVGEHRAADEGHLAACLVVAEDDLPRRRGGVPRGAAGAGAGGEER